MAIARVQDKGEVDGSVAFDSNNTAGNLLVCCIQSFTDITDITDTAGNDWVKAVDLGNAGQNHYTDIWYVENCLGSANTVTAAGHSFGHLWIAEYSGIETSGALDKTASAENGGAATDVFDSGATATTAQADELLVGCTANFGAVTSTWTEPDTEQYDDASAPGSRALSVADEIVAGTGTYSAVGTYSATTTGQQSAIATFKAAAGGAAGQPTVKRFGGVAHGPGFAQHATGVKGW